MTRAKKGMLLTNYPFSPGTRWLSVIGRIRVKRCIYIYKGRNCIHKNRTLTEPRVSTNSRVYKHISGNTARDGWVHIRLCTGDEKREVGRGEGITRAWKRGGKKKKKRSERNFFSSQFYFIEVPFGLTLTSSDHFYWHRAMNLKLRQWGTFSSLPGFY